MGASRDYYADLELPPTADVQEIKKQFRKLALQYHPDRNPGREAEVNSKFQIIQAAHEVLSDPEQKAKFDETRARSNRQPGASGVRGNPWSHVSQQFPTPPRRNANPTAKKASANPTSGAERWQTRFSHGVPPTAKQRTQADPDAKKNAAKAFENMRKGGQQQSRPTPPPPPPRTEYAKQRAEASFGARKTGFHPRSTTGGDEPPVPPRNYTNRASTQQNGQTTAEPRPVPDPLRQFREQGQGDYMDSRERTPYGSQGGEKTNPFDGVPIGRAKSSREPSRRESQSPSDEPFSTDQRNRSSSVPRYANNESSGPNLGVAEDGRRPHSANESPDAKKNSSFRARAANAANASSGPAGQTPTKPQRQSTGGPSMYETPQKEKQPSPHEPVTCKAYPKGFAPSWTAAQADESRRVYCSSNGSQPSPAPSGSHSSSLNLTLFEREQHILLDRLINNMTAVVSPDERRPRHTAVAVPSKPLNMEFADKSPAPSFNIPVDDDTFEQTSPGLNRFGRSSVDDINTSFVDDDGSNSWQFSAGSGEQDGYPPNRTQSGSRSGRRSPTKRPTMRPAEDTNTRPQSTTSNSTGGFNADGWSDKFGPQTFVPQANSSNSASPTRATRTNSRKAKPAKAAAGNAPVVIDISSDEDEYDWRGRKAQGEPVMADSPQAMDIDSPPSRSSQVSPQLNSARNIHVEPSRPDWRPGNVTGANGEAAAPVPTSVKINPNSVGSEDTEEFQASLADLKNVAPFAQPKAGLKSFDDLKDNLPFESKSADDISLKLPKPQPLVFPAAPEAPRLPPTMAIEGMKPAVASWTKYAEDFETYLKLWDTFNARVVDHFAERKMRIMHTRASKGFGFLTARGEGGIQEYYNWVQQDNEVRERWAEACQEHEQRFREFMAFREKMK